MKCEIIDEDVPTYFNGQLQKLLDKLDQENHKIEFIKFSTVQNPDTGSLHPRYTALVVYD